MIYIYPKNILAKFQKDLQKITPVLAQIKPGHMDGQTSERTSRQTENRRTDAGNDNIPRPEE